MEIIQTTALITINETLWVQMTVFLVFVFLINRIMFRPVRRNLTEREAHFEALRTDIAAMKTEMNALIAATEDEESRLMTSARRTADDLREESRAEARRMIKSAIDEIKGLRQTAEEEIRTSVAEGREQVGTASEGLSRSIIHRLVSVESRT